MNLYGIFGAGGFGREVMPLADASLAERHGSGAYKIVFVDDNEALQGEVNGIPLMRTAEFMEHSADVKGFNITIADYRIRRKVAESLLAHGATPFSIVAANSVRLSENTVGEGAILCPFTTITSNATIGRYFHANIYSYVAHDCIIGDFVTFAPSVHCNGHVVVEDNAYIGTGAVIKQGADGSPLVIGEGAVVGMGAVVNKSVPPYTIVAGVPAKRIGPARQD